MAQGKQDRGNSATQFSSFSILDGVMVKIGDKFCPPKQITLSQDIFQDRPSSLLDFEYDFSLEESVLAQAEEERKSKETAASIDLSALPDEVSDVNTCAEINGQKVESTAAGQQNPQISMISADEILQPEALPVSPRDSKEKVNKSFSDFNLSEFEDNNATPFELVELQTIDDLDELKSVLQPEQSRVVNNSKSPSNVNHTPVNSRPIDNTSNSLNGTFAFLAGDNFLNRTPLSGVSHGTTPGVPRTGQSVTSPSYLESSHNTGVVTSNNLIDVDSTPQASLPTVESTSNLTSTNSRSLPSLVPDAIPVSSQAQEFAGFPTYVNNVVNSNHDDAVPTRRVTDIMRQYQFTRIPDNIPYSGPLETTPGTSVRQSLDNTPLPSTFSRYGQLPPLNHIPIQSTYGGMPSVHYSAGNSTVSMSRPTTRERSPQLEAGDYNTAAASVIPPIKQEHGYVSSIQETGDFNATSLTSRSQPQPNTWLPDPTAHLTSSEKQLVTTLCSMGFPAVRTARAVKRIGTDQKQVIEYLLHVQEVIDMGHNGDDAEVALADSKTLDEALKYLQVFRTLKEFGFLEPKIQDAMKRAAGDRDAALEILMT